MTKHGNSTRAPTALHLVRDSARPVDQMSDAMRDRLRNQLTRAFRHAFGAEQGLRVVVKLATTQLLEAGATRDGVRRALSESVKSHPASSSSKESLIDGVSRSSALVSMMLRWSDATDPRAAGSGENT